MIRLWPHGSNDSLRDVKVQQYGIQAANPVQITVPKSLEKDEVLSEQYFLSQVDGC